MFISSDTNVWVDFQKVGHLDYPFRLNFVYYISRDTFCEEFLTPESMKIELLKRGLQFAEMTDLEFTQAMIFQSHYRGLSQYDAFALAIAKQRGWTLLTGDMPLRKAAMRECVDVHGIIWIYDQLKDQGKMTDDEFFSAMNELIDAVKNGRCRLPMEELLKRRGTQVEGHE